MKFLSVFWIYNILISTLLGVVVVYLTGFDFGRLSSISELTKELVLIHVVFSVIVLIASYVAVEVLFRKQISCLKTRLRTSNPVKYLKLARLLTSVNLFYLFIIVALNKGSIPAVELVVGGGLENALQIARETHLSGGFQIPYVSKFFEFSGYFTPLLILAIYIKNKGYFNLVFVAYVTSFFLLSLDLQKAPFLLLVIMSVFLVLSYIGWSRAILKYFSFFMLLFAVVVTSYSRFMDKRIFDMFFYLLDRPIFGQVQGMYYMYEYYPISREALFSNFFFKDPSGVLPPDVYIAPIVYPNTSHIVNVNSYFIGEAWSFGGSFGVFLASILVGNVFFFYCSLWLVLCRYYTHFNFIMAFVFFSILPINQSLQFVIYQKYFLYFFLLFYAPVVVLASFTTVRLKGRVRERKQASQSVR